MQSIDAIIKRLEKDKYILKTKVNNTSGVAKIMVSIVVLKASLYNLNIYILI